MNKDKNEIIRQLDDIVINAKTWSFWEDTTIQDLEILNNWKWRLLITKWWDNMSPFSIDIKIASNWLITFLKSERELEKDFKKKYE